jgi:hypothetical protein
VADPPDRDCVLKMLHVPEPGTWTWKCTEPVAADGATFAVTVRVAPTNCGLDFESVAVVVVGALFTVRVDELAPVPVP